MGRWFFISAQADQADRVREGLELAAFDAAHGEWE